MATTRSLLFCALTLGGALFIFRGTKMRSSDRQITIQFKKYYDLCCNFLEALERKDLIIINIDVLKTQNTVDCTPLIKGQSRRRSNPKRKTEATQYKILKLTNELRAAQKETEMLADMICKETIVSDKLKPVYCSHEEITIILKALNCVKASLKDLNYTEEEIKEACDLYYEKIKSEHFSTRLKV